MCVYVYVCVLFVTVWATKIQYGSGSNSVARQSLVQNLVLFNSNEFSHREVAVVLI